MQAYDENTLRLFTVGKIRFTEGNSTNTSAHIWPGYSGGMLMNQKGELVGINSSTFISKRGWTTATLDSSAVRSDFLFQKIKNALRENQ